MTFEDGDVNASAPVGEERVSLTLYPNAPEDLAELAQHVERLGFSGVWIGDHIVLPVEAEDHPYRSFQAPAAMIQPQWLFDSWVIIGQILGSTTSLEVASGVTVLALRHPLAQARAAATASLLGGGRFRLGAAIGWLRTEYEALGVGWANRGARLEEIIAILRAAFAGGAFEHHGEFYDFEAVQLVADPIEVPIIFGGDKPRTIERAARLADGWYGPSTPLAECIEIRERVSEIRAAAGITSPFEYHVRIDGPVSRDRLDEYLAAGFTEIIIPWPSIHSALSDDQSMAARVASLEQAAAELGLTPTNEAVAHR